MVYLASVRVGFKSERTDLMGGHKVSDEKEHAHHDMLGNRGDVGARDFKHLDPLLGSCVQVDVIRTDTSGDAGL